MKRNLLTFLLTLVLSTISLPQIGGYALQFSGTRHINCGNNATVQISGSAITLEAWVYPTAFSTNSWENVIVNKLSTTSHGFNLRCGGNGIVEFYAAYDFATLNNVISDASTLVLNKWTHLAGTYDGSTAKLYVNGSLVKSSPSTSSIGSTDLPLVIGNHGNTVGGDFTRPFIGSIDEVRIWNTVRTEAEIKASMYKELAGNETNLLAYYKMSNGSGTSLTDNSVNSNTGTLTNGPTWKASGCFAGPRNALDFDGTNDYVDCGTAANTKITDNLTISAWVKTSCTDGGWRTFLTNHWLGFTSGMILAVNPTTGLFHYAFCQATGVWTSRDPANSVTNDGKWHNIVITFQAGIIKTYFDGKLIDTYISGLSSIVYTNERTLQIGRDSGTEQEWWQGQIDEVSIWSRVLSENEVRENMTKTLTGTESNLAAYYRFDHVDGKTLYDLSSNAYNGTLYADMTDDDWVSSSTFNTWIGSESNSWSVAANWSSGTAPAATDNVGLYKWDLGNEVSVSGALTTVNNLLFSSTASPVLSSNFTVNGNLLLGKNLDLNGITIRLGDFSNQGFLIEGDYRLYGSSGTISVESSWNNFSGVNVGGLGAVISCNTNIMRTITRGHTEHRNGSNKSILRYYQIIEEAKENAEDIEVTLKFNYLESELNGLTESDLTLFKSTDNGTTWTNVGGVPDINANNVTLTGISNIEGLWTLGSSASPLPVELTNFSAKASGNGVVLSWQTATEVNNYGFEVERKSLSSQLPSASLSSHLSSEEWEQIEFVKGSGNSNSAKEYSFTDKDIKGGKYQYRLKQIDNDGKFSYSEVIEVEVDLPAEFRLEQNYPNPFNPSTTIEYQLHVNSLVKLELYSITGERVATLVDTEMEAGYYNYQFSSTNYELSSGIYFYQMSAGEFLSVRKFVIMK
ncbi:MAG: LamG-like jellyroll fold domain-containing protein [Ignavibacteriaceae bacterium]